MTTSDAIDLIATALTKAQATMKNPTPDKVNPAFKSEYASLGRIRDTVIPPLAANGIAVVQTLDTIGDGGVAVFTRLIHTSGQWLESVFPIPNVDTMQKMGGAVTYARRYALTAIAVVAADADDDGNEISKEQQERPAPPRTHPRPATAKAAAAAPVGFQDWVDDITAASDEGRDAFDGAWAASRPDLRNHLIATNKELWNTLKARAGAGTPTHAA